MKRNQVEDFLVPAGETIADVMRRMDRTARRCLFVVDDSGHLLGSLSDGDIRRLILRRGDLGGTAIDAANTNPKVMNAGRGLGAPSLAFDRGISAIPVLDENGCVVDILFPDGDASGFVPPVLAHPIPVVMMAGGKGTRLLPLTAIIPKPLIPVKGVTIAERIIGRFFEAGCQDFWLVLNYKREMIRAYFSEQELPYSVHCVDEETFRGTGGGVKLLEGKIDSTFILTNCDILVDVDVNELLAVHTEAHNVITAVCSLQKYTIPYGTIEIGEGGQIVRMTEKPTITSLVNTGVYVVEPEVFSFIGEEESVGFPDIMLRCQEAGLRVGVFPIGEDAWLDMGQMNELRHMTEALGGSPV